MRIGVVGLGSMGYGMAASMLRAGHVVHGADVNSAAVARLAAAGAAPVTLSEAAPDLDALAVVVLNAAQVEAVLFGPEGLAPRMRPGAAVVCCVTVPPDFARAAARRAARHGLVYLDAPISGGSVRAAEGRLTIMASGPPEAFAAAAPLLEACAERVFALGDEPGRGSAMKAVNQMLAGVHIAAMAEAITFGMTQGIAPETFLEVIPHCAGTSWMLENRAPHVVAGDYTPHSAVDIWPKDLGIVTEAARGAGFPAPLAEAALARFAAASAAGLGREDDAAVAKVYAAAAGLSLPGQG